VIEESSKANTDFWISL